MVSDYIYVVHCEQHKHTNIYKIGRTSQQEFRRFNGYPKNSELLLYIHVSDSHKVENEIIDLFKQKYKQIPTSGIEYFQGDVKEMVQDIVNLCLISFDITVPKPIAQELLNVFPNYKYDVSFGGRHRLCLLHVASEAVLYYIKDKDLESCSVDCSFAKKLVNSNMDIKNDVYFKYTEKLINSVLNQLPYKYTEIYNAVCDEKPEFYTYGSFLDHPEILFRCNCKIKANYSSISFCNNCAMIGGDKYVIKFLNLISQKLLKQLIPVKTLFTDAVYGVIFEDEFTDDVDCTTLVTRSVSLSNDIILYYLLYNEILSKRECLIDGYTALCTSYLSEIAHLFNDVITVDTIKHQYNPFSGAHSAKSVLKSFKNYVDVMSVICGDQLFDSEFNYGLYWLLTMPPQSLKSGSEGVMDWLFEEFGRWIRARKLNYQHACKWWFNNHQWDVHVNKSNLSIVWNKIEFKIV